MVWANPLSLATTYGITIVFSSSRYLDVSVPRVSIRHRRISCLQHDRFPHSDIRGSKLVCSSPWLFAAYHVLLRSSVPRHPSRALYSLTYKSISTTTFAFSRLFVHRIQTILNKCISKNNCGANRARTDNLRLARAALSQLSYSPLLKC